MRSTETGSSFNVVRKFKNTFKQTVETVCVLFYIIFPFVVFNSILQQSPNRSVGTSSVFLDKDFSRSTKLETLIVL